MKAREAKPLSNGEMVTFKSLFERWLLRTYPYYGGSSEESDAMQTYLTVKHDIERGRIREWDERTYHLIDKYGEVELL